MRLLALDLSTKTGFALFESGVLSEYGLLTVELCNFNVNDHPNKAPEYPFNIVDAADHMALQVLRLCERLSPDMIVVENTVKGRNRHTQRILEFIHKAILDAFRRSDLRFCYLDPSEWRGIIAMRLTDDDKKNNRLVSKGEKRGRITKKHLSVRIANERLGLKLKIKDNDIADAMCMGLAYWTYHLSQTAKES